MLALVACDKSAKEAEVAVASVSINPGSIEMVIGETSQLRASISPSNATEKNVSWASSKQSVATVSESGLVSAVAEGTATITASVGGKSGTCSVTVSKGVIAVASVELDKASLELIEGESETLTATVKPNDATDKTVTWSTSNASIATVENGKVTAIKEGEATITATAGSKSATCKVVVAKKVIAVSSVELNKTTLELVEEESETLVATVKPDDATDKTVTWSTSNASIATVENGKVTAIKEGEATITAAAGGKSATCRVVVAKKVIAVESIELNKTTLELEEEDSETLLATVKPDEATDKTITWSTSDASVAMVEGGKVTAIMEGTATITAKAGDKSAECKVIVSKKVVVVTSVKLSKTSIIMIEGNSETMTVAIKPDDATDKTVTWSTSDASVATVEGCEVTYEAYNLTLDGCRVTAVKEGEATITATVGGISAACKVNVVSPLISGLFSAGADTHVKFARGNLRATTYDYGDTWSWALAAQQWDRIGDAAANFDGQLPHTTNPIGTVDLFGWSTDATYYGICSSTNNDKYKGEFLDWGTTIGAGWRTLTKDEWIYVLETRATGGSVFGIENPRYAHALINSDADRVSGVIVFPDGVVITESEVTRCGNVNGPADGNTSTLCTTAQWTALEAKGCVFLPATGCHLGNTVTDTSSGYYWSSTSFEDWKAFKVRLSRSEGAYVYSDILYYGCAVRLVQEQ